MATIKFGNTWWGQEWLNSFNNIYDSNRLPRGQRYARNGSVVENILSAGVINAKVQGSRPRPYKINITLPLLTKEEKQTIINTVTQNPYYLAQLLSSKLPAELNNDLLKQGVQLFPKNWHDFSGNCSCPDYANPCKHLAAIIYQIANKIDVNPFTIFAIKGFDLLQNINQLYGDKHAIKVRNIIEADELNQKQPYPDIIDNLAIKQINQIDFSKIVNIGDKVLSLLPHQPLFYLTGDYHTILTKHYKELTKIATTMFSPNLEESNINPSLFTIEPISIASDLSATISIYDFNKTQVIDNTENLINFIKEIPHLNLLNNSTKLNSLYLIFHFTKALVINGAYTPQLYSCSKNQYIIRYVPIITDESINQLLVSVSALLPEDLVIFNQQKISQIDQCLWLIALFIKHLNTKSSLYSTSNINYSKKANNDSILEIINAVFSCQSIKLTNTKQEFINHISLWLERFCAPRTKYKSLLQVTEHKNDFKLELLFKDTTVVNSLPTSIITILEQKDCVNEVLYYSNLITEYIPALAKMFTSNNTVLYSQDDFIKLFFEILPIIKLIGIEALLPKSLKNIVLPSLKIAVTKDKSTKNKISYLNLDQILSFDWQISIGDNNISVTEFKKLLKTGQQLVKIKDQYIYLDEKLIDSILATMNKPINVSSGAGLLRDLFTENSNNTPFVLAKEVQQLITKLLTNEKIEQPNNLLATLRDYQYQGYCWLYKNIKLGFGSVIADDMGLGKTLQVITCLLKLKQEQIIKKALIIVPTSLLTNWQKELNRFAPELSINIYHGTSRSELNNHDITLITYGTVRRDIELINKHKWDILVIDEAQNIKNLTSQQTKLIKSIKSKYRIAMSGTPVENRLLEYYSIMDFANKGYLGSVSYFNKQFAIPIESHRDIEKLNKFLNATKPFVLRRLKNDKSIIKDLPDKTVIDEYCNLTTQQTALYQATLDNIMKKLKNELDDNNRRGLVLSLIMALKQICNHPSQYLKQLDDIDIESSGKLSLLLDKIKDIHANNEKVLIFTQFAEMGTILQNVIEQQCNTPVLFLHGGVSRKKRDEMVESIQNNSQYQTMVLSIKAGGVGLNLTSANHVIHYDLWWNPAVENQATDRAYRIGQNKNVFVHRLVCSNSFEEKINQMIKDKQELANLTIATGEQWIGNLSNKELQQIFTLT